jgi:hypothetical protein
MWVLAANASDSVDVEFYPIPPATRAAGLVTRWVLLLHRRRELRREDRARQLCQLASKRHAIRYLGVVGHAVTVMQSCFRLLTDDSGLASAASGAAGRTPEAASESLWGP